jgi:hypothetical protein
MATQEDLLTEVRASIEKALPAIQVDVFRKYMDEAEKTKKELADLKVDRLNIKTAYDKASEECARLRALELDAILIKDGKAKLELDRKVFEIERKLDSAALAGEKEKTALVRELFTAVFRNIEVRSTIFGQVPCLNKDSNGNTWMSVQPANLDQSQSKT